ncbi:MAG: YfiR family protein [Pseudomonadales bacterium]|nr:YfiR family protein [Pseudomonadales bacterium]
MSILWQRWLHLTLCLSLSLLLPLQVMAVDEKSVKAAIVYNFSRFVREKDPSVATRMMCVLGDVPEATIFDEIMSAETLPEGVTYQRLTNFADMKHRCQIAFMPAALQDRLQEFLQLADESGLLTISDADNFIEQGGMVGLEVIRGKVRFSVHVKRVADTGMTIDSQLLRLARIVE